MGETSESRAGETALPGAGETIAGKYLVEGVLGKGGMGVVLAARHQVLGQEVAIKFLLPEALGNADAVARFLREARTAAALRSEHVARVVDVGTHETGALYIVMERLVGSDLDEVLASRGTIPFVEAVEYVIQACDAIREAHGLGIVHRDLKPANLFLTWRPNGSALVKVLDFGISKLVDDAALGVDPRKLTTTGAVMGSPVYMSPEQVRDSTKVDARTDVWSLGILLHELVSGRHPFEAPTVSGVLAAIAADPPVPLRRHLPAAPEPLEEVVLRCLDKDVTRRMPDVATLVASLRGVLGLPEPRVSLVTPAQAGSRSSRSDLAATIEPAPSAAAVSGPAARVTDPFAATQGAWGGGSTTARRRRKRTLVGAIGTVAVLGIGVVAVSASSRAVPASPSSSGTGELRAPAAPATVGEPPPPVVASATARATAEPTAMPSAVASGLRTVVPTISTSPSGRDSRGRVPPPPVTPRPSAAPESPPPAKPPRDPLLDR